MIYPIMTQYKVVCDGCQCGEIISVETRDLNSNCDPGRRIGFKEVQVHTNWGAYCFRICPRCQNNLDRMDLLRLAIPRSVSSSSIRNSSSLVEDLGWRSARIVNELGWLQNYTKEEVESEAWKLIERGIISVDEKGILKIVEGK